MGRELKRVPLDFAHPIEDVWPGYLRPEVRPCPGECDGGQPYAAWWAEAILWLLTTYAEAADASPDDRNRGGRIWPHPYLTGLPNAPSRWHDITDVDIVQPHELVIGNQVCRVLPCTDRRLGKLLDGLGASNGGLWGRDAGGAAYSILKILLDAAGMDHDEFFKCEVCGGTGVHPEDQSISDEWERTDPPVGDGFQLWETTSEGSPVSPVFATLDELCEYAAANCNTFADQTATAEQWRSMLDGGLVTVAYEDDNGNRIVVM